MRSFVLLLVLASAAFAASAQLYRWTDEKGRVHVTDTPPPASAKNVRQHANTAPAAPEDDVPYSVQRVAKDHPVTLYTAPNCAPCGPARALLNARGVPFREVLVVDEKQADELKKVAGSLAVPSMRVGDAVQAGFEAGIYEAALDRAGYPRAGAVPARHQAEPKPAPKPAAQGPAQSSEADSPGSAPGPYAPR
jgi:glutaredoxin